MRPESNDVGVFFQGDANHDEELSSPLMEGDQGLHSLHVQEVEGSSLRLLLLVALFTSFLVSCIGNTKLICQAILESAGTFFELPLLWWPGIN